MANQKNILEMLKSKNILFFDGGIGTMLQKRGLPAGVSPELFCIENPEVLAGIHADYAAAGADILTTNTFGGNALKLPKGLDVCEFNAKMAALAKNAAKNAGRPVFVAGSVGPTGKFLKPLGELDFNHLIDVFTEQITGLVKGGADLIQIETQIDIAEARAAVIAARNVCNLPVSVSMTFEDNRTLTGSTPEVCVATLENLGVDIIATNCSAGPAQMLETVKRLAAAANAVVLAQPNAGLPELIDGETVFRLAPDSFAELTAPFVQYGARMLGGCCGTTPDHIKALRERVATLNPATMPYSEQRGSTRINVTSRSSLVQVGAGYGLKIIGERINPTGKKQLSAELVDSNFTTALRFADEQSLAGASLLDVNVGAPMVDELKVLPELVSVLTSRYQMPLSLDSSNIDAIEAALAFCPASPLVNSISGEAGRMERLGPLCKKFGAPFILLPLKGKKLPVTAAERIAIIEDLLVQMEKLAIPKHLAMVDALVLSVSSKPEAAVECFKFIKHCTDVLGLPTTAGLSNISFGLPARELINSHFLAMAASHGLSSCIANPQNAVLREAVATANLLTGQDKDAVFFVDNYTAWQSNGGNNQAGGSGNAETPSTIEDASSPIFAAVVAGKRENILPLLEEALQNGVEPFDLVNNELIPAITIVGEKYEKKEYFLPQLLRSAETMQTAFALLKPLLENDSRNSDKVKIVMATVEGDIHDIGKNIVILMLGNHGFEVIDLGKDVKAEVIVDEAVRHGAKIIGLSALMTTTMIRMKDTVDLLAKRGIDDIKVMVGGAVVTQSFATMIGAHGYSTDAVDAVRMAKTLLN